MNLAKKIHKTFFSAELPIKLVTFNIILIIALASGVVAVVLNIVEGMPPLQTMFTFLAIIFGFFCLWLANYKSKVGTASVLVCFFMDILTFPIIFFTGGGINCGMASWFTIGLLFIFMLLDGIDFFFMLLIDIACIITCFLMQYYSPWMVTPIDMGITRYVDVIYSLLSTTIAVGAIIKFQTGVYNKLFKKAEANNDELLESTIEAKREQQIAQIATETKSNFLANMSHEIRTPINVIVGMDEMILRETNNQAVAEYAMDIKNASSTLLSLINDILDITKIESGKMDIVLGEYDFISFMQDIVNGTKVRIKEKELELKIDVSPEVPRTMIGDDIRIKQVLNNILTNAIKYTHEGSVKLKVDCRRHHSGQAELTFYVTDTGIGIKEEDISRLFEAFERLEVSRNRNIEGAGLGMAITQNLLKMMNSNLNIKSKYGEGSTFSFTILQDIVNPEPIGDFEQEMRHMLANYEYSASFTAPNASILVVDDNALNRKVFISLLKECKARICEASSGKECLQLVQNQHFDIIFLDHMMPSMDGVETFIAMKSLENNKCRLTPVIALTANAIAGAKEKYLSYGFKGFLAKPIIPAQLEKVIRETLPEALLIYSDVDELKEKKYEEPASVSLPSIEGIDWDYAMLHFPNEELVFMSATDFYESISYELIELASLANSIDEGDCLDQYRIKVHSLKSMANTIGAASLGGLAYTLEKAARDGKVETVKALSPILVEEGEALKTRMSVLFDNIEKPKLENMDDLYAMLEMVKMSVLSKNSDGADNSMKEILKYSYGQELQEKIDELSQSILKFEYDKAIKMIDELQGN